MPKTKISEFSSTPGNNTDIDGINIAEGCAPSGINDAIRELMSQLKDFQAGTAGDSFNGPVGTTTAAAGAFTTLSASGAVTLSGGTANGVAYLNGSKVLTTGSALTFDGSTLAVSRSGGSTDGGGTNNVMFLTTSGTGANLIRFNGQTATDLAYGRASGADAFYWGAVVGASEWMRLTSTGLGIGTSSPFSKLDVKFATDKHAILTASASYSNSADLIAVNDAGSEIALGLGGSTVRFYTGATERMRLSADGNLGLGVTPSAWGSIAKAIQIGNRASVFTYNNTTTDVGYNAFFSSAINDYAYIASAAASFYRQTGGQHQFFTAPSGTAGNAISFTQAMTLDASGNFYVGTTSQSGGSNITFAQPANADMKIAASVSTATRAAYQVFINTTVSTVGTENSTGGSLASGTAAYATVLANSGAYPICFATNNTERARIDSSGNLLVGTTSLGANANYFAASPGNAFLDVGHATGVASSTPFARFLFAGSSIGSITQNGTTAVAYNTSSDYRLKENIAPMTGALAKVAALKPCTYKWKADGSDGEGFIAHELAEVVPQCVTGEKDAVDADGNPVYQGIDTSFLVATLTAALQEAHGLIKDLQSRVAALEAK